MPQPGREDDVAERVEWQLRQTGRRPGPRLRRDESQQGGLSVDFTYDHPEFGDPLALEVTTLRDQDLERGWSGVSRFEESLTAVAEREGLGGWTVAYDGYESPRGLEPVVIDLMRDGQDVRVKSYTGDDLRAAADPKALIDRHRTLAELGLVSVERSDAPGVRLFAFGGGPRITGFAGQLTEVIADNAAKLARTRPRETHLAVEVVRYDASGYPAVTPPPALPAEVDVLWVFFRWAHSGDVAPSWRLQRGDSTWTVLTGPMP